MLEKKVKTLACWAMNLAQRSKCEKYKDKECGSRPDPYEEWCFSCAFKTKVIVAVEELGFEFPILHTKNGEEFFIPEMPEMVTITADFDATGLEKLFDEEKKK